MVVRWVRRRDLRGGGGGSIRGGEREEGFGEGTNGGRV